MQRLIKESQKIFGRRNPICYTTNRYKRLYRICDKKYMFETNADWKITLIFEV